MSGWAQTCVTLRLSARREGPRLCQPRPELRESWSAGPLGDADALSCFDSLTGLEPEFMIGQWRGAGLPTAHPLDGVLEALGWYGKAFESVDRVHPLLFRIRTGGIISLDPTFMPVRIALRWPALAKVLRSARRSPLAAPFSAPTIPLPSCEPRTFGEAKRSHDLRQTTHRRPFPQDR